VLLFAWPNAARKRNDYAIGVPNGASLILTHTLNGEIKGINEFGDRHPPVFPLFWGFRVMVGMALLMLSVSWLSAWRLRKHGEPSPWLARALTAMTFSGWLATLAGWYVTEIGRQPYLVYGLLLTKDAASSTPAPMIGLSLAMYLSLYVCLILAYASVLLHLARKRGAPAKAAPDLGQEMPA